MKTNDKTPQFIVNLNQLKIQQLFMYYPIELLPET